MSNELLTPHFSLSEFVVSRTARSHGINNTPPPEAVENLRALCVHTLEPLRMALDLPIIITSGYRTKQLNHLLTYHSVKSQHMEGQAADFYVAQAPVSGPKGLVSGFKFQVSGSKDLVQGSKNLVQGSKFKVQGYLNHQTGDSSMKLETGDSPMKLGTGDSPMKLGTGDGPMKLGTGDSPMKLETGVSPMKLGTGDSPMKLETRHKPL